MPSGSSLVTRTQAQDASSRAVPGRPFRVGSDGLPLLPCHGAPVTIAPASSCLPAVAQFGHVDSHEDVREQLVSLYTRNQQIEQVSEMTLRIDTELELLRRSCFAQRNAQWGNATPDLFEFQPVPNDTWTPQPANDKLLLRKMKMEGVLDGSGKEFYPPDKSKEKEDAMEFVRDRPWPPREFALKPVTKPSRGRGGKRKAAPMAAVLDPVPVLAKTCLNCKTQSTPLWRTQTRTRKVKKQVVMSVGGDAAASLANAFVAQNMANIQPQKTELREVDEKYEVDLCLKCYLKLERADLFDKKRVEKKREERRKKDQAAAAVQLEKKRLKQQIHQLKKQQKKQEKLAHQANESAQDQMQDVASPAAVILKFTREEIEAATAPSKERKKDRKHSRKDKKKKKKHRRRREHLEDSDSDGPTPIPSPAQMNGYVYADRTNATPQTLTYESEQTSVEQTTAVDAVEASHIDFHGDEGVSTPARSSSRKRKSVQYTEAIVPEESPSSASKKRKTSSSRTPRSKRAATSEAPVPVAVAAPPVPSAKKRARTKKELARERELRALGQYCPVCNEVYEDDDQSTFVCCDSCELWVHGACDPSLTPYVPCLHIENLLKVLTCFPVVFVCRAIIAAMTNTDDKYICPLCAGR
ncbi:hypothetical protein P3T76_006773 [Phytophthora citrophthora]|uniref:PHD-type domain-containing protein n=1 Tax=Phytophthora citrophthora TaxID=4793 RepID=A0AAD9LP35_9STRA|nr:hypothetical protein P3T76_006773 [Phytophthora citrophthora]